MKTYLHGYLALEEVLKYDFDTILDVGSGKGRHAEILRANNKQVTTVSLTEPADIVGDFLDLPLAKKYDVVWASHVLEHQRNAGIFLEHCYNMLNDDGILAVTVPPLKQDIVGGHVSLWNAGLLLYNLILSGFDCSKARVKWYGYNISVIVRKKPTDLTDVGMCTGDIERLSKYFPMSVGHGFNGIIEEINW